MDDHIAANASTAPQSIPSKPNPLVVSLLAAWDRSPGGSNYADSRWAAARQAKLAATCARATTQARAALARFFDKFATSLAITEDEAATLLRAIQILRSMEKVSTSAVDSLTHRATELKLADEFRREEAQKAIHATFKYLEIEDIVLLLRPTNNYHLMTLSEMRPESLKLPEFQQAYEDVMEEAFECLLLMVKNCIISGQKASAAALEIRERLENQKRHMDDCDTKLVETLRTITVAARLVEASSEK